MKFVFGPTAASWAFQRKFRNKMKRELSDQVGGRGFRSLKIKWFFGGVREFEEGYISGHVFKNMESRPFTVR